ncbi:MAG: hypothetical protein CL927_06165 [Deltaproteobacteria bacterium]|nr:hypothetical protein [Deltaproteobacteria bacterium]
MEAGEHDVVVLDELNLTLSYGYIETDDVVTALREKPDHVSIILTGRRAPQAIIDHRHDTPGDSRVAGGDKHIASRRRIDAV